MIQEVDISAIVIIAFFFLVSILIGWFASRKGDAEGFLVANRTLGLFQSVMTLSGTFVGAMMLLVYTAFVFTFGISALWIFIGYFTGFLLFTPFAIYLYKYSKDKKFYTIADFFKFRFGNKVALLVISIIFLWYFGSLSAQFIGGGKILSELTGMSFSFSAIVMCVAIIFYLVLGGFRSVVRTDVFQFIVLGIILVILTLSIRQGLKVPLKYFNPFNAGIVNIVAFFLLGVMAPFATQDYWQRIFAMKSVKVVKYAFIISGILVLIVSFFLTYIGLVARSEFSNIDADLAVVHSFTRLAPDYLAGFVAIVFFAAILSTADTYLFLLSVNFTNDISGGKIIEPGKKIKAIRLAILLIGILSLALALIYPNIVDVTIIFKAIGLIVSPIVIIAWISRGNRIAIVITICLNTLIIIVLSAVGYVKPELAFVGIFGGFIFYGLAVLFVRILSR